MKTRPVYVAGSARIPFQKSLTHYSDITTQELMTAALEALVQKMGLQGKKVGDSAMGALMNSPSNWNLARESILGTSLSPYSPAYTLQRACGTSLEAALQISLKIANYQIDNGIAGGVDSNSDLPVTLPPLLAKKLLAFRTAKAFKAKLEKLTALRLSDFKLQSPEIVEPRTQLSMGQHCERMVQEWGISREAQDEFALKSHENAIRAYNEGFYSDLVVAFRGTQRDSIPRVDTSLEKLAKLKPAFDPLGTLTAGNSSPLTDGAAAVYLTCEETAQAYNHPLLARFVDASVAAVDFVHGEGLLMAPVIAVHELLQRHQLTLQSFDFYEIHEAFAGQVLCTLKAFESTDYCKRVLKRDTALGSIDRTKLNVKGSSIALGHPFAATGARIVGTLAKLLHQNKKGRGLISICTAGGMGIAAILEAVSPISA